MVWKKLVKTSIHRRGLSFSEGVCKNAKLKDNREQVSYKWYKCIDRWYNVNQKQETLLCIGVRLSSP